MFALVLLLGFTAAVFAQSSPDHRFTFDVGGGITPLTGQVSQKLDNGWHVTFGGGYNFNTHFSTSLQFMWNGVGVSRGVLNELNVPDGNAHIWALTVEPKISLGSDRIIDPYFIGGIGYYRRVVQFTQPTVQPTILFDPFFGFVQGFVPANIVLGTITRNGVGGSAGLGFEARIGSEGLRFFTEARYHYADTGGIPTRMVPVTFGIRW